MIKLFGWLYWNPERVVFTIPFINRPVVWYGLWFVFGFIVGYFLLIPMFQQRIQESPKIGDRDIQNWDQLAQDIKSPSKALRQLLDKSKSITVQLKKSLLEFLNESGASRSQLEVAYPKALYSSKQLASFLVDRLTWFVVGGTIIGARLGHVFFYDWHRYQNHYWDIIKVWEGGLASHGGVIGVMIGLFLYKRLIHKNFPEFSMLNLLDMLVVPSAFVACCIRIGNFFNQEILGKPSSVPWAIIFGDPFDDGAIVPRHPVQLYEAGTYLITFGILYYLWKKRVALKYPGMLTGVCFILIFTSRFFIEFLKMPQSRIIDESFLQTGQYLSLPFIALGLGLVMFSLYRK